MWGTQWFLVNSSVPTFRRRLGTGRYFEDDIWSYSSFLMDRLLCSHSPLTNLQADATAGRVAAGCWQHPDSKGGTSVAPGAGQLGHWGVEPLGTHLVRINTITLSRSANGRSCCEGWICWTEFDFGSRLSFVDWHMIVRYNSVIEVQPDSLIWQPSSNPISFVFLALHQPDRRKKW